MKKIIMIIAGVVALGAIAGLIWLFAVKQKNEGSRAGKETAVESTAGTDEGSNSGSGESAAVSAEEFEKAAAGIDGITIPEGTRIVALGEATHGNIEFQELKLELFKHLVETTNVRALILEGDIGGCQIANLYIQGGEGTAEEVTEHLGYKIYRTDQMCELVKWMREYNETAADGDKVRLYGMDMQYDQDMIAVINAFYGKVDASKQSKYSAKMTELLGDSYDTYKADKYDDIVALMDEIESDIDSNSAAYIEKTSAEEVEMTKYLAENIKYFISYCVKEDSANKARDTYMKKNVDWFLGVEETEHKGAVMIGCHNGHMTQSQINAYNILGSLLNETYGDSYFAIGTDFYLTKDNVPNGETGERVVAELCSDDPLAAVVKDLPENRYYIDFSKVDKDSSLGKVINDKMTTGSVGEYYDDSFKTMKPYYQISFAPTDLYDAMIFYYEVNPIVIWGLN
ncbi:MAG: erythromycin esterase family protein [Eubacterium sp.]|nr:erythromycin esterase family protein [Eubacterium sp.]